MKFVKLEDRVDGVLYHQYVDGFVAFTNAETQALNAEKADAGAAAIEALKVEYKHLRAEDYPSIQNQLDIIYNLGLDAWKVEIKKTKDKYPKPI